MNEDERGDAIRGIPKIRLLVVLEYYLGVPWESPSLGSFHSLFHNPWKLHPKYENFATQNSTENLISSFSIRKHTTFGTVLNSLFIILVLNLLYYNFSMVYKLFYQPQIHQNKQTTHEKQNLSKTEQSVVICRQHKIWNPKNSKLNCWK